MPTIRWDALPKRVKDHLLDRLRLRQIDAEGHDGVAGLDKLEPCIAGWSVVQGVRHIQTGRRRADTENVLDKGSGVYRRTAVAVRVPAVQSVRFVPNLRRQSRVGILTPRYGVWRQGRERKGGAISMLSSRITRMWNAEQA
jgi:hypothetical protein